MRHISGKPPIALAATLAIGGWMLCVSPAAAGEPRPATAATPAPVVVKDDPFAEILKNSQAEIRQTGPSCQFIKIQLPPGVSPDEIPGPEAR